MAVTTSPCNEVTAHTCCLHLPDFPHLCTALWSVITFAADFNTVPVRWAHLRPVTSICVCLFSFLFSQIAFVLEILQQYSKAVKLHFIWSVAVVWLEIKSISSFGFQSVLIFILINSLNLNSSASVDNS